MRSFFKQLFRGVCSISLYPTPVRLEPLTPQQQLEKSFNQVAHSFSQVGDSINQAISHELNQH